MCAGTIGGTRPTLDRIAGAVVGALIGDALDVPEQFLDDVFAGRASVVV